MSIVQYPENEHVHSRRKVQPTKKMSIDIEDAYGVIRRNTAYYAVCILDVDRVNTAYASAITPAMLFSNAVHTTMHCILHAGCNAS